MAQTVAIQRGITSVVATSTGAETTLFTQSGGAATRVIINQLTFYSPNTQVARLFVLTLNFNSSGGYKSPFIYMRGNGVSAMTFIPGPTDSAAATQQTGTTAVGGLALLSNTATSTGVSMGNLSSSLLYLGTASDNMFQTGPTNFWMGPGDSISVKLSINADTPTCPIGYSFTTITES